MINSKTITQKDGNSKKKRQKEMLETNKQTSVTEIKNDFDGLIHRLNTTKEGIHEFDDMLIETSQTEMQRGRKQYIQELWGSYKRNNISVVETSGDKKRDKGTEEIFEGMMAENFLKLMSHTKPQIQDQKPPRIKTKKSTHNHDI